MGSATIKRPSFFLWLLVVFPYDKHNLYCGSHCVFCESQNTVAALADVILDANSTFQFLSNNNNNQTSKMFASMLKDHQKAQEELKAVINSKRVIAEKAVESLTANSVGELNDGVAQAYLNQHKLDSEARKLQLNVSKLSKQTQQWMTICNSLNAAVKDFGDICTWTKAIDKDVKFIASAIEKSYQPMTDES